MAHAGTTDPIQMYDIDFRLDTPENSAATAAWDDLKLLLETDAAEKRDHTSPPAHKELLANVPAMIHNKTITNHVEKDGMSNDIADVGSACAMVDDNGNLKETVVNGAEMGDAASYPTSDMSHLGNSVLLEDCGPSSAIDEVAESTDNARLPMPHALNEMFGSLQSCTDNVNGSEPGDKRKGMTDATEMANRAGPKEVDGGRSRAPPRVRSAGDASESKRRRKSPSPGKGTNCFKPNGSPSSIPEEDMETMFVTVAGRGRLLKQSPSKLGDHVGSSVQLSTPWSTNTGDASVGCSRSDDCCEQSVVSHEELVPDIERSSAEKSNDNTGTKRKRKTIEIKKRLVWTQSLHERFVKAAALVGIENAVPKTILEVMNVEGLTTEHVKSHLQKFRNNMKKVTMEEARERNGADLSSSSKSGAGGDRSGRTDPLTSIMEIESLLEFNERTMQSHLQLQLVVHRLNSLHRKMQLTIETMNGSFGNEGKIVQAAEAQWSKVSKEHRDIQSALDQQHVLLKTQFEEHEDMRRKLLQKAGL